MILLACDLDNTLIYSYKKLLTRRRLVEEKEGKALSYMTEFSYQELLRLPSYIQFLPVTTRSLEQYERICLPVQPSYALAANGGILLIDGKIDQEWYRESKRISKASEKEFEKALRVLEKDLNLSLAPRMVDGLFLFTKSNDKDKTIETLNAKLDEAQASVFSNGQKVYVVPKGLNKGKRLSDLRARLGSPYMVACGDSLFDVPMLLEADFAIYPEELELGNIPGTEKSQKRHIVKKGAILSDEIFEQLKLLQKGQEAAGKLTAIEKTNRMEKQNANI